MKQLIAIFTLLLVVSSLSFAQSASGVIDVNVARAASIECNTTDLGEIWLVKDATKETPSFLFTISGEGTATIRISWDWAITSGGGFSVADGLHKVAGTTAASGATHSFPGPVGGAAKTISLELTYLVTGNTAGMGGELKVTGTIDNYSI